MTVRIEDASGNLVTGDTRSVTVALGSNPGGSTLSGTKTVSAVGGVATFSTLSLNNAGNGYTLSASASGLTGATSSAFNITTTPPPPTGNIVVNGGFESGTSPWQHYQNGGSGNAFSVVTDAPVAEGSRKAAVTLGASIGTNNQIWQQGLPLDAATAYQLQFMAYAAKNTTIRVRVIEQDDDYTVYGFNFQTINLTTGWQTFTVNFTTANFAGTVNDAMVQFFFPGGVASNTLYFDGVQIAKEGGVTPPPPTGNLMANGSFEAGTSPWQHYQNGGGTNSFSVVTDAPIADGARKAKVVLDANLGTNNQIWQQGLVLQAGVKYRLQYSAYASKNTPVRVRIIEQDDDYTVYGFQFVTHNLTTSWQTFTVDFTAGNFSGTIADAMLQYYFIGGSLPSTTLYFDNVILSQAPAALAKSGDGSGEEEIAAPATLPTDLALMQNYPNPFNPSTQIAYTLPGAMHVRLEVYNTLGERVATLADEVQSGGYHTARFDARDLPSGLYFYRLTTDATVLVKKMLFMK